MLSSVPLPAPEQFPAPDGRAEINEWYIRACEPCRFPTWLYLLASFEHPDQVLFEECRQHNKRPAKYNYPEKRITEIP